ncbi:hypothetical protein HPP92_000475 [Vanilla planifolia]|uniref:Uncharacterized protein n=1 Tax=Vanilla planifolia TaxID=51239 RepID=A0A835RPZ7_VANPL|nr:hypothetical protein HPP92_000475 [Vanilla planifolia]
MAGVYVDLLQGKPRMLAKLKQCSNTRYLSTGVNDAYEAGSAFDGQLMSESQLQSPTVAIRRTNNGTLIHILRTAG